MKLRLATLLWVFCWLTGGLALPSLKGQERPNVVLVMTDDQGWWDLGIHGNPYIETPFIDKLAGESVEFTHFYASPVCTPTRAALLTGRHYQRTGAFDTYMGRDTMRSEEITLGEVFRQAGYQTGLFGKWHLGRYMKYHPNHQGFGEFVGFWQYGFIQHYFDSDQLFHNGSPIRTSGYITDVLTDAAIGFMRSNQDRPFFLYLPFNAPHSPFLVGDSRIEKYLKKGLPLREARIYGMITAIDENVGRLLKTLDNLSLRQNTVFIFMSDNGGVSRAFNAGLRGRKGSVYEGGVRVPFIARWPDRFPAGAKVEAMAQHIDLFPTLCELIGVPLPADRPIDGRSILSLLRKGAGSSPHAYLFHQWNRVRPLFEPAGAPLPATIPQGDRRRYRPNWAVRDARGFKLVLSPTPETGSAARAELFDLNADPGESKNLAPERPGIVRRLRSVFEKWFREVTAGQSYDRVSIEIGRADENPVELDVTWGEPVGREVRPAYHGYDADTVDHWTRKEDFVRWKVDIVREGRYEVLLSYGCPPGDEGSKFLISLKGQHLDGEVKPRAARSAFETHNVGTLELPQGPGYLSIRPVSIAGGELMTLHKIWLRKIP